MESLETRHPPETTGNEDAGYCSSENPERSIPHTEVKSPPVKIVQPTFMPVEAFIVDANAPVATSEPVSPNSPSCSSGSSSPSFACDDVLDSGTCLQSNETVPERVPSKDEAKRVEDDRIARTMHKRRATGEDEVRHVSSSSKSSTSVDRVEDDDGSRADSTDAKHGMAEVVVWQEGSEGLPPDLERRRSSNSSSSSSNASAAKNAEGELAKQSQILRWTTSSSSDATTHPEFMTLEDLERELARQELELTATVPELLESMNASSQDVNECESRLAEEEKKYNAMVAHWQKLDESLRAHYGSSLLDRTRPYFEAAAQLQSTSDTVQNLVREYGEVMLTYDQSKAWLRNIEESLQYGAHDVRLDAQQQEHLSKATMRVLVAQQQRDHIETCYTKVLGDFQHAQAQEDARRREIGISSIDKVRPCFKQIERYQLELKKQEKMLDELDRKTEMAKIQYDKALGSLETVNNSVHALRQRFTCLLDKMRREK